MNLTLSFSGCSPSHSSMFPWSLSQGWQLAGSVSITTTITITITRAEERPLIRR